LLNLLPAVLPTTVVFDDHIVDREVSG